MAPGIPSSIIIRAMRRLRGSVLFDEADACLPLFLLFLLAAVPGAAQAQQPPLDSSVVALAPLEVTATPFSVTSSTAPFSVSTLRRSDAELNGNPALTLDRLTYTIPGLQVSSREHYALGDRITVRGLGWRAQFGVRGLQILMDGIPLTAADGQSILNIIDPSFVREIEVIRGPSSTFWGNSSGGVVALSTRPPAGAARARVRQTVGSFGLSKTDVQVNPALGRHQLSAYTSYLRQDGYRAHSGVRISRTGLTGHFDLGPGRALQVFGAYANMPDADNPGSLDKEAAAQNPGSARRFIVQQDVGKSSQQGQLGATYSDDVGLGTLRATAYGVFRSLENPIPSDYIDLGRRAGGARLTLERDAGRLEWGGGLETKFQQDDRKEFSNVGGAPDSLKIDQQESVYNQAAFGRVALSLGRLRLSAGARYDWLRFAADDRLGRAVSGASGRRTFQAFSPSLGVTYTLDAARLFANVSTALEAPATTELGNRPDGQGGFNPNVDPERTLGFEAGARGAQAVRLSYDVAFFAQQVRGLLLPYELEDDGPTYFRNEGRAWHLGAEAALEWRLLPRVTLGASYTYVNASFTDARAQDGMRIDGNRVPGVPAHYGGGFAQWRSGWLWATLEAEGTSTFFVDSKNTAQNEGYVVLSARLTRPGIALGGGAALQPFLAVRNLLDARYNGSIIVNAFGDRYYEPSAGRHWQFGLALQLE